MKNWTKLTVAVLVCELVGIFSTPFTLSAIPTWYTTLVKPFFSPPNWLFGPIWTVLYFLMGVALYFIWKQGWSKKKIKMAGTFFLIQLVLNFLCPVFFFGLRSPLLGFIDILLLLILIVITMRQFYAISKLSFYLLIPYVVWVSFATVLNGAILVLN